jgi:hypothetical protein
VVRRVEFLNDRTFYIILRDQWCNIISKSDDVKDSFCEKLGHVFDHFPGYDMKILLGNFSVKISSN